MSGRLSADEALALSKRLSAEVVGRKTANLVEGKGHRPCRNCYWAEIDGMSIKSDEEMEFMEIAATWQQAGIV